MIFKNNPYFRAVLIKRIHYSIYWLLIGAIYFSVIEIILRANGDSDYLPDRILLSFVFFSALTIVIITLNNSFYSMLFKLRGVVVLHDEDFDTWAKSKTEAIFTYKKPLSIVVTLLCVFLGNYTISVKLPFQTVLSNAAWIALWQPLLIIGGHASYSFLTIILFLFRATNLKFEAPFYRSREPGVMALWNYYITLVSLALVFYISLVIVVWASPFGFIKYAIGWLVYLSFFPLATFLCNLFIIHSILKKIKQHHLDSINEEVQAALALIKENRTKDNTETLANLMTIQKLVNDYPEWPLDFSSSLTLIFTLIVPLVQIIVTNWGGRNP